MKAVILAAGSGERLTKEGLEIPKPLIEVGGLSMLERTIRTALKAGASECVVVLGSRAEIIQSHLAPRLTGHPVRWVINEQWPTGNGSSVLAVRSLIKEGERFLILMADHLLFAPTLKRLIEKAPTGPESVMAVDFKKGLLIDPDDATKVQLSGAHITLLDKKLASYDAIDTGLSLCTSAIFDAVEKGAAATPGNCSHTGGMRELAKQQQLLWHDIGADRWEDVDSLGARRIAEKMLFQSLRKSTDGFLSRYLERHLSLAITRLLIHTPMTPNRMTVAVVGVGAVAAWFFAQPGFSAKMVGALLFWASSFLDGCDGEIARLKFMESRLGGWLDLWSDNIIHMMVFTGIGIGLWRDSGQAYWVFVGIIAAYGVLFSVSWVSWNVLRKKSGSGPFFTSVTGRGSDAPPLPVSPWAERLSRWADAMSRRDFIFYLIFITAFGFLPWFLWAAAIGSHIYWMVLVALAFVRR